MRDTGAATAAVHLSYFLRDRLYPGIRDKKCGKGFRWAPREKSKTKATQEAGHSAVDVAGELLS